LARRLAAARQWPPRARPAAIGLCLVALAFFFAWWLADLDSLDAWTPNIVVGLIVLAATITFVEWIVQREAAVRTQPRVERALDVLGNAFWRFAFNTYTDIVFTNLKVEIADLNIPSDPVAAALSSMRPRRSHGQKIKDGTTGFFPGSCQPRDEAGSPSGRAARQGAPPYLRNLKPHPKPRSPSRR